MSHGGGSSPLGLRWRAAPPRGTRRCWSRTRPPERSDARRVAFRAALPSLGGGSRTGRRRSRSRGVWTCTPRTPDEVVAVVSWAWRHGYRARALGRAHTWSPLVLAGTSSRSPRVLLVDTTRHLTRMRLAGAGPAAVVTQTGATMDDLLAFLEAAGLGMTAHPAPGDLTVGGVLAIDGHGTAIPSPGERRSRGQSFGSLSNLVLSLTAVVWSERRHRYVLRTFDRDDPVCASLLTNLGRAFVTAVTLRAGPLRHLRCVSYTDVPAHELFAGPGAGGRTFASFLEASGWVEAIWYPFTDAPWLKVWSLSRRRPAGSRLVRSPYNFPFSDTLSDAVLPRHPGRQPRLPGHRALGLCQLPAPVRHRPPRMVKRLGLHRARGVDEPQDDRPHPAPRLSGRPSAGPKVGRCRAYPRPARPARRLHEPPIALAAAHAQPVSLLKLPPAPPMALTPFRSGLLDRVTTLEVECPRR
jgi:hypothetical protein